MRRSDRLFDIIQRLRTARGPTTAAALADDLEVTVRTVYRDVATLQARRVPIEGAPGVGYVLRRGFDLPPLMFSAEEIAAIAVGARLVARTGDPGLQEVGAARRAERLAARQRQQSAVNQQAVPAGAILVHQQDRLAAVIDPCAQA